MVAAVASTPYVRALLECVRALPGFESRPAAREYLLGELAQLKPRWLEQLLQRACFQGYDPDVVPTLERELVREQIEFQLQQLLVLHLNYRAEQAGRSRSARAEYKADLAAAVPSFAGSIQPIYEAAASAAESYGSGMAAGARWHQPEEMTAQPQGWYWSTYPGHWIWYCPTRNQARGIDFADACWHELLGGQYWGPYTVPVAP